MSTRLRFPERLPRTCLLLCMAETNLTLVVTNWATGLIDTIDLCVSPPTQQHIKIWPLARETRHGQSTRLS